MLLTLYPKNKRVIHHHILRINPLKKRAEIYTEPEPSINAIRTMFFRSTQYIEILNFFSLAPYTVQLNILKD